MAKKTIPVLLFLVIAILGVFFVWRYVKYVRDPDPNKTFLLPRLKLSQVEITSFTAEKTEVTAKILITNELPVSFTADSVQFLIFIENTQVMKSRYKKAFSLKGADSSLISLPITVINHDLIAVLKSNERKNVDSVEYRVQASFYTHMPLVKKFHIDIKTLQPLYHVFEVKAKHINIDSLNFSRVALRLIVTVKNRNGYSLRAKNVAYEFSIDKLEGMQGVVPGTKEIGANRVTELQIPLRLPVKNVVKTLLRLLKDGKSADYKLHLNAIVDSDNGIVKDCKVTLESSGSVGSLREAAKK
jgi:LEA14-like dessication related protein